MKNTRWEDILFENRNKAYGAYELRTNYHARLNRSFLMTLSALTLLMGIIIVLKNQKHVILFKGYQKLSNFLKPVKVKVGKFYKIQFIHVFKVILFLNYNI